MIDLEKTLKELEKDNILEITTKELKERGLTDYYIKKALTNGSLEKTSRGKYQVVNVMKKKKRLDAFKEFVNAVFNNRYEEAYDYLLENYQNQTTHDYDHHLKLYFILLKEILGDRKDFSFLDDMLTFSNTSTNGSYYKYFNDFSNALLASDFDAAFTSIRLFKAAEKERKGEAAISTKLFLHLTYNIVNSKRNQEKNEEYSPKQQVSNMSEAQKNNLYKKYYRSMMNNIEKGNYEAALESIKNALNYSLPKGKDNLKKLAAMISKYLELKDSTTTLADFDIDYSDCQDDYNKILNRALDNGDYKTAFGNIGKCVYFNKNSITLNLYRSLLYALIEQSKENERKNSINSRQKVKKLNEVAKKQPQVIDKSQEEKDSTETQEPEEIVNELESSNQAQTVDIDTLCDLIYNREYDQVRNLLEKENQPERLHHYIMKMMNWMDKIANAKTELKEIQHNYRNDEYDIFKRFFEALSCQDYKEAARLVDKCKEISERRNNSTEFIIYQYMFEDIENLEKELAERLIVQEKITELEKKQKDKIYATEITEEDIAELEKITNEIMKLSIDEDTINSHKRILELLDTLKKVRTYKLDKNSFEEFTYDKKSIIENYLEAIKVGDYQTANALSKDREWNQELAKNPNRRYLIMYKRLINQICRSIDINSLPIERELKEEIKKDPTLEALKTLKSLIKKRKYRDAYIYCNSRDFKENCAFASQDLQECIQVLFQIVTNEAEKRKKEFKYRKNRGDYQEASECLEAYQEYLENNNLNRNLDYYWARFQSDSKETLSPDFVEKEQLYDRARYYRQMDEYEKGIEVLTEYISKDNDVGAKGYLLRGRLYERIRKFAEAQADYEKAISIIPEPNAYHRLGKIHFYNGKYQEAIECFLEYEKRRLNYHYSNMKALRDSYSAIGDEESSGKYEELIKLFQKKR